METRSSNRHDPFDFIDRFAGLFRRSAAGEAPPSPGDSLHTLSEQFATALLNLEQTIARQQQALEKTENTDWRAHLPVEDEETKRARQLSLHRRIRTDIEAAHALLQTGIAADELDLCRQYQERVAAIVAEGETSHEIIPRCRHAILKRIHREAGILALEEMDALLRQRGESWPETVPRDPVISAEEAQAILRRKQAEARQDFLDYSIRQSSFLIVGIVEAWKSDYPNPETPLWQSVVFEAVATALRARRMQRFSSRLQQDQAQIEAKAAELIGGEVAQINRTLHGGITSLNDAHRIVASSMRILDEIIPGLAWEHLRQVEPAARGEAPTAGRDRPR